MKYLMKQRYKTQLEPHWFFLPNPEQNKAKLNDTFWYINKFQNSKRVKTPFKHQTLHKMNKT
jgi:hypothetical protein